MRRAKGFSLLEFILYFALLAILITAVVGFAADVARSRTKAAVVAETEQNARFVMQRILRAVRQADKLNVGASAFDVDSGVLSLDQPATSTTPTVFSLSGGAVRILEGSGTATPITSDDVTVTRLRFSRDNLGGNNVAITTQLTVTYDSQGNPARDYNYTVSTSATAVIRKQ